MKNVLLRTVLVTGILSLWCYGWIAWAQESVAPSIHTVFTALKENITTVFNTNLLTATPEEEAQKIKAVFLRETRDGLSDTEAEKFAQLLQKKGVQDAIYAMWKKDNTWKIGSIALALLLWIGYAYAYGGQMAAQLTKRLPINTKSFITFWSISGMMTLLNGIVPGSLVYFESFVLAFASVAIHGYNKKRGVLQEGGVLEKCARNAPFPMVGYNREGSRLIWNKQMEDETGYSHAEVMEYRQKNGDIISLIYGQGREKIREHLDQIAKSWEGHENTTTTMMTKTWEEKTFHWTAFSDGHGGILCTAKL